MPGRLAIASARIWLRSRPASALFGALARVEQGVRHFGGRPRGAQPIDGGVDGDAVQPGRDAGLLAVVGRRPHPGPQQRVLRRVLGGGRVGQHAQRRPPQPQDVAAGQSVERSPVAGGAALHQILVGLVVQHRRPHGRSQLILTRVAAASHAGACRAAGSPIGTILRAERRYANQRGKDCIKRGNGIGRGDFADGRADAGVPRLRGRQGRRAPRRGTYDPCADRPQRRRQDHVLQSAHKIPAAHPRRDRVPGPRHHRHGARHGRAARAWCAASRSPPCSRI